MTKERHAYLAIHGEGSRSREIRRVRTWRKLRLGFLSVLALLLIGGGMTFMRQRAEATALAADAKSRGKLYASVVHAEPGNADQTISLPGTLLGLVESPISSRASGYLVRWTKDIGSQAKRGELLAEVSSPETEQQLAQAMAARQQSLSALNLAKVTMDRWKGLLDQRAVSQQEFDERRSAYEQAVANLGAVDANIQRLFTRVVAPFDGVITKRNVNVGDLIDPGAGRPLFVLTQASSLRAYVYVPQAYSKGVQVGQSVTLTQAELPGQSFKGRVVRTAKAIDPATRSLQVEVGVENPSTRCCCAAKAPAWPWWTRRAWSRCTRSSWPRISVRKWRCCPVSPWPTASCSILRTACPTATRLRSLKRRTRRNPTSPRRSPESDQRAQALEFTGR